VKKLIRRGKWLQVFKEVVVEEKVFVLDDDRVMYIDE
jgi:hypothetical protein